MNRAGAVVVLGGGPSLTASDVDYCRGKAKVIAIKEAARLAPWADVLYSGDGAWLVKHRDAVRAFAGPVATIHQDAKLLAPLRADRPDAKIYRNDGQAGLCTDPDGLRTGRNSGYQAINLAYHMGANLIVLLGIDLKAAGGRMHWFHRDEEHRQNVYLGWRDNFRTLIAPLAAAGVRVVNCSPDSALDCFPKMRLREALA